jgi:hypothetical protein
MSRAIRGFHPETGVLQDSKKLLEAAGLGRDADRLRSLQARLAAAYESGRLDEGDRLAAQADLLVEKIDNALIALEEEGEPQQEPIVQSVTRQFAEAWQSCMHDAWNTSCRDDVNEYRRTGHGKWNPPSRSFIGPPSRWIGARSSAEALRQAAEHPEWYREEPGYFKEPNLVHSLRDILGDQEANGLLLLDAAEDAWNSMVQVRERIRAGAAKRRTTGVDPVREAKRWARRMTRKKKRRMSPKPNWRRTSRRSRRRTSRRRSSRI